MVVLWVLAGILLVLVLVLQLRVGVQVVYNWEGPSVRVRLGPGRAAWLHIRLYPRKRAGTAGGEAAGKSAAGKKKKREKKPGKGGKGQGAAPPVPLSRRIGGALGYAMALLPILLDLGRRFAGKLQIDTLTMELTAGGPDPAQAAMLYGRAQAALGALWFPLTEAFQVKDGHAWARIDFDAPGMLLYVEAALSLKMGQILLIGLYAGGRALRTLLAVRRSRKQARKAV